MSTTTAPGFFASPVAMSSVSDDWATPQEWHDRLVIKNGYDFVLDVCADNNNSKAPAYYGLDHVDETRRDGLEQDWAAEAKALGGQYVWMNPPYGKTIGDWMRKAYETGQQGVFVVCLVPARTDTKWFQDYALRGDIHFVRGRLKFGGQKNAAPFPSALVVFGPGIEGGDLW